MRDKITVYATSSDMKMAFANINPYYVVEEYTELLSDEKNGTSLFKVTLTRNDTVSFKGETLPVTEKLYSPKPFKSWGHVERKIKKIESNLLHELKSKFFKSKNKLK